MSRRPLPVFATVLILAAHPASAPAGEPIETGKPFEAVGTVTSRVGRSGPAVRISYTLRVRGSPIGLLLGEKSQAETLNRLVASRASARFRGVLYKVGDRRFLFLDSIEEFVAPADGPIEAGKPWKATGTVTVQIREFTIFGDKPIAGRAYFLTTQEDVTISLQIGRSDQPEVLDRLATTKAPARVEGTWHEVNRRHFLRVERIIELTLPPRMIEDPP
jgi:hypothetical protein